MSDSGIGLGTGMNPIQKEFILNPFTTNINLCSIEGSKLYLKATEEVPQKDKLYISISNGTKVSDMLEKCRSKYAWGVLLSKVPDNDGDNQDVLKNYRALTIDNVLAYSNTYLGNRNLEAPPADKVLAALTPGTNNDHKRMFFLRVRSQMIAQKVFGTFDQASINKLMTMKKKFTWKDSNGDNFYDGLAMAYLIVLECNPETKISVQVLRNLISSTKASEYSNNIPDILQHISSTMDKIVEMGETHDNLMKNTFDALLTAPNTVFHQYFTLEKMSWQGGTKTYTFDQLSEVAKTIYNNMVSNGTWNDVDPKDA